MIEPAPSLPPPPSRRGLLAALGDALRGTSTDYTSGSLGRAILLLAIPMVLEMVMESVFAVVDVFFVGKLGPEAVATVGLTETILSVIYAVAMGLSIGVGATVARRIGERDADGAAHTAVQGIVIGLAVGALLGVGGAIGAPSLLRLLGASPAVVAVGSGYARVMLGGSVVVLLLFLINAIFRGAGDAAYAMRVLWVANGVNLLLDPCLIFGLGLFPRLGVIGAGIATTSGRALGVLLQLWLLGRRSGRVSVGRRHLAVDLALIRKLLALSASGVVQVLITTASWIGLVRVLARFGDAAIAGNTVGFRIILFALLPSWGLSNAAATLVGQALGAGKPERAEAAVWRAGLYNLIFLSAVGALYFVFAEPLARLFCDDADVLAIAADCLRVVSLGFPFYAYGMVLTQSFNGAGDTATPTWLNLACFWFWEIPLAWLLSRWIGSRGVFLATAVSFSTLAVASAILFRRGGWKRKRV